MGELMKTACKSVNGTAVAPLAKADGTQYASRKFESNTFSLLSAVGIRDTANYDSDAVDISGYGLVSLRVANTLKDANGNTLSITLWLSNDVNSSFTLHNIDGTNIASTIAYGFTVVLPDDIPLLSYLATLKIRVKASGTPASGSVTIDAVCKR